MMRPSKLSSILATGLVGFAAVTLSSCARVDRSGGAVVCVHDPERELGSLPVGRHAVEFRIENGSPLPGRVVGAKEA